MVGMDSTDVVNAAENKGTPSGQHSVFRVLTILFGMIAILLSLWAGMLVALLAGRQIVILLHVVGYQPATFTIEKLVYVHGQRRGNKTTPDRYWAEGTVAGQAEKFTLGAYLKSIPANQEDLEKQVFVGQKLPVLYNSEAPDTVDARVLFPEEDFKERWLQRRKGLIYNAYMPLGVALGLCLLCSLADRRWTGLKFVVGSLPFALMGWAFALLDMLA